MFFRGEFQRVGAATEITREKEHKGGEGREVGGRYQVMKGL